VALGLPGKGIALPGKGIAKAISRKIAIMAVFCGHLEPVPKEHVDWARRVGHIHPWTVVHQSSEKWRAAQDYSVGTNRRVISKPFTLTSVRDHVVLAWFDTLAPGAGGGRPQASSTPSYPPDASTRSGNAAELGAKARSS